MSQSRSKKLIERGFRLPVVGNLLRAAAQGQRDHAKDMSASIAYFTFLSLFPLILGIVAISAFFLNSEEAQARVNGFLVELLPVSSEFVTHNIDSLLEVRGAAGLTSIIVLLWSARKMVSALSRAINGALGLKRPHAFYLSWLRDFGLTLAVTSLIFVTIAVTPLIKILADLELGFLGDQLNSAINLVSWHSAGFLVTSILLGSIYLLVPFERQHWKDLLPGIVVAATLIELGKELFVLHVENVSRYDTLYGSVSSIIVLLIWLYFSTRMVLYGTEIIGVYRSQREGQTPP
jgi:membrane protein